MSALEMTISEALLKYPLEGGWGGECVCVWRVEMLP